MKHGQKQKITTNKAYFLTLTVIGWVDVFTRKNHRDAVIELLKYCQKKRDYLFLSIVL